MRSRTFDGATCVALVTCLLIGGFAATSSADPSKCDAAKVKAAGKKAAAKANCYAKAIQKGLPVDPACLTKAEQKFDASFQKADTKNDNCTNLGDSVAVEATVDQCLADLVAQVSTTPTTTLPGPSCTNGMQDGTETDVDCGGGSCPACAVGGQCVFDSDCSNSVCTAGTCTASCSDGIQDGAETGVDCGGGSCPACAAGQGCLVGSDCQTFVCSGGLCAAPSCADGIKNGSETDVDCGGGTCPACSSGQTCAAGSDCVSLSCVAGQCS